MRSALLDAKKTWRPEHRGDGAPPECEEPHHRQAFGTTCPFESEEDENEPHPLFDQAARVIWGNFEKVGEQEDN